jgi:hypothetical protein
MSQPRRLTRGLWFNRNQDKCTAALVVQDYPSRNLRVEHPVELKYDPSKRRLVFKPVDQVAEWTLLSSAADLAKPVFIALHLLRDMNPELKVEAFPLRWICPEPQDGTHTNDYFAMICSDAARLVKVNGPQGAGDWYGLRNWRNDPFTVVDGSGPSLHPKTNLPFGDLPASLFRAGVAAKKAELEQLLRKVS